jgi:hypothetical protein
VTKIPSTRFTSSCQNKSLSSRTYWEQSNIIYVLGQQDCLIYTNLSKTVLLIYIHIYIWRPVQRKSTKRYTFWCLTSFQLKLFSLWWQGPLYLLQGHARNIRRRSGTIWRRSSLCLESLIYFVTISLPRANITYAPASIFDCPWRILHSIFGEVSWQDLRLVLSTTFWIYMKVWPISSQPLHWKKHFNGFYNSCQRLPFHEITSTTRIHQEHLILLCWLTRREKIWLCFNHTSPSMMHPPWNTAPFSPHDYFLGPSMTSPIWISHT